MLQNDLRYASPPRHQNAFTKRSVVLVSPPRKAPTRPNLAPVPRHPSSSRSIQAGPRFNGAFARKKLFRFELSGEFPQVPAKAASRRNQHALRAASPRTPTPVLLALLRACSFRLEGEAVAWRFPLGAWLGRSATSCGHLVPLFGIASSPVANIPTEAAGNEERRFHSETAGTPMKLRCENQFG